VSSSTFIVCGMLPEAESAFPQVGTFSFFVNNLLLTSSFFFCLYSSMPWVPWWVLRWKQCDLLSFFFFTINFGILSAWIWLIIRLSFPSQKVSSSTSHHRNQWKISANY
jgi:hypothetical protein